ncbi:MAG: polynucleotide adenylyltransferase PcnB [Rhabdochlamydiaceae bacterium]|jgi:poly(A) polymerase
MNPKIYQLDEHTLDKQHCDPDALKVIQTLQQAGHVAYLVGGSVRDLLLGISPKDYDMSTSARPEEIKSLFRSQCLLIGRRFRLAHIRHGRKVFEVSTFRAGDPESDALIVRDNEWGTPEQDVMRRDFTINGLFYDPSTETVIDYVDGYPDLQKKYLRTIGQPYLRFKQDPVRMIRLLKFVARFNFEIDPATNVALAECCPEILKSSQARIFEELLRMLESGASELFIDLMHEHRFLELLTPAFAQFLTLPDGEDVLDLLYEVDLRTKEGPLDRALLLCCLTFPFLQKHIQVHFLDRGKTPHLGEIEQEIQNAISNVFRPFFLIPRKLRMKMTSIMIAQFRMTPLHKQPPGRRHRIPRDPDFPFALEFLHIRSTMEPALKKTWQEWQDAYTQPPHKKGPRRHA